MAPRSHVPVSIELAMPSSIRSALNSNEKARPQRAFILWKCKLFGQ